MQISMTGYGKATAECGPHKITFEIRSLNSKQLDLSLKLPMLLRDAEMDLRSMVAQELGRGKVECIAHLETTAEGIALPVNTAAFASYLAQMRSVAQANGLNLSDEALFAAVIKQPEVMKHDTPEPNDNLRQALIQAAAQAIEALLNFRQQEGQALERDLLARVDNIGNLLTQVESYEAQRTQTIRQRLTDALAAQPELRPDNDRLEQELIFYIEKLDITEEKVRLRNHCRYFYEICTGTTASGRKLGFIAQEMGREINTLGSKANHAEMQKIVVLMKDELEKIKEQVLNVL